MSPGRITEITDTALIMAACRALEHARPDALVRDPFAKRLAGDRGMAVAQSLPNLADTGATIVLRTRFFDELLLHTLAAYDISAVLSLGSGLDTRPWRLRLPASVRWIEVDLAPVLEYKSSRMAAFKPRCAVERLAADLNDPEQRAGVFTTAGDKPALIVTEGLLALLPPATVEALAIESTLMSGASKWLLDIASPATLDLLTRTGWVSSLHRGVASDAMELAPERIRKLVFSDGATVQLFTRA